jgi:hypothetical protein
MGKIVRKTNGNKIVERDPLATCVIVIWQHIRWKPTSPCKLWKLQPESHDVDPTGCPEEVGGVICKITFANHASHLA